MKAVTVPNVAAFEYGFSCATSATPLAYPPGAVRTLADLVAVAVGMIAGVCRNAVERARMGAAAPPAQSRPAVLSAARVLGVAPDAPPDEIREAFRRALRRVHPDLVGAAGTRATRRVIAARDVLLRHQGLRR